MPTLAHRRSPGPGLGYTMTVTRTTPYGERLPGFEPWRFELEGPRFTEGALDPITCRTETVFPPSGTRAQQLGQQPRDVIAVLGWQQDGREITRYDVSRCDRRACLEAFYDPVTLKWSCTRFGEPCAGPCLPVPPEAWFTREDSLEEGPRRVGADELGAPLPTSALSSTTGLLFTAVVLAAILLIGGRS